MDKSNHSLFNAKKTAQKRNANSLLRRTWNDQGAVFDDRNVNWSRWFRRVLSTAMNVIRFFRVKAITLISP
jgi:hypothetical protein